MSSKVTEKFKEQHELMFRTLFGTNGPGVSVQPGVGISINRPGKRWERPHHPALGQIRRAKVTELTPLVGETVRAKFWDGVTEPSEDAYAYYVRPRGPLDVDQDCLIFRPVGGIAELGFDQLDSNDQPIYEHLCLEDNVFYTGISSSGGAGTVASPWTYTIGSTTGLTPLWRPIAGNVPIAATYGIAKYTIGPGPRTPFLLMAFEVLGTTPACE